MNEEIILRKLSAAILLLTTTSSLIDDIEQESKLSFDKKFKSFVTDTLRSVNAAKIRLVGNKIETCRPETKAAYGDDIVLQKGDKELLIPYGDEKDRDVTIKYFNDFVKPDYEVRWFAESLGDDTLGFTVLSGTEWLKLEDEFGADIVCYYFVPIDLESNMFNLSMSEVSALLELRENKR